jgi:hypothetical protein
LNTDSGKTQKSVQLETRISVQIRSEWRACKTGGGSQTDFIIDLLDDGKQVFSAWSSVKPIDHQKISDLLLFPLQIMYENYCRI